MEMNKELLAKAKEAKAPEELLALAKENGVELRISLGFTRRRAS